MKWQDFEQPERWIEALEDERPVVRSEVLKELSRLPEPPPEATSPALRQIEKHGWTGSFQFPHLITRFPHTEESFDLLVKRLHELAPRTDAGNELMTLCPWLGQAPVAWLDRVIGDFVETIKTSAESRDGTLSREPLVFRSGGASFEVAVRRMVLSMKPGPELRKYADELLDRCVEREEFPHQEVRELEFVARIMASRGECLDEAAGEWLDIEEPSEDRPPARDDYRVGFALMLLREARRPVPLEGLLRPLRFDWDWMNELYSSTLTAIADAPMIGDLLEVYPGLEWYQRLFSSSAVAAAWWPENEAAVMAAAEREEEDPIRVRFASALVVCGTDNAGKFARMVAAEHPNDPNRREILGLDALRETLCGRATADTRGRLEEIEKEHQRLAEKMALLEGRRPALQPAHKQQADVGRNDPCPCGSGRKYKKCCL